MPTATPTVTSTATATATPTETPVPALSVLPSSGPAGIEITISGSDFVPYGQYVFYWAPPDVQIGDAVYADDVGQILPFTYTVPVSMTVGGYDVIARFEGNQAVADAPFEVTE
jgi:hypothetical protein